MSSVTKGVQTLLGNPKKAIIKLSLPIIASHILQSIYYLTDTIWVSGLGANALAAVGFFFPIFYIILAINMGLSIGGGSTISRKIGEKDRENANLAASTTLWLIIVLSILFTLLFLIIIKPFLIHAGAKDILPICLKYALIMIFSTPLIMFEHTGGALLRSEGDTNRAMLAMSIGTVLNIILDPIFIYGFKMGIAGAAIATVISVTVSASLIGYWLFIQKRTYVSFNLFPIKIDKTIAKDIFLVGIPASFQYITMSLSMAFLNKIVSNIAGAEGIAIMISGWRIILLGSMPVFAISAAVVSITGAAYGAKDYQKLKIAYHYAIKIAVIIEIIAVVIIIGFAPQISLIFTYSKNTAYLTTDIIQFLRITAFTCLAISLGPISSAVFQGIKMGFRALTLTILRTIILLLPFCMLFAYFFNLKLRGVWLGIVAANSIGAIIAFTWVNWTLYQSFFKQSIHKDTKCLN